MEPSAKVSGAARLRIEQRVREISEKRLSELGLDLVDSEYKREPGGTVLRLFIDKPGGVNLDDCQQASRRLEKVFESEGIDDLIPGPYDLEVSSPGLFRPLKRSADYERAVGRRIKIHAHRPVDGQAVLVGTLERFADDFLFLRVGDTAYEIELANIAKANMEPELQFKSGDSE